MFKAVIKAETLKSVIYIVNAIVDEVKFSVNADGVRIKAIDPSHIAMIDINILPSAFLAYEADTSEIGLDIDKVKAVLKLADSSAEINLEHDEERNCLIFRFNKITRRMSLVDTSSMIDPKVPPLEINHCARILSDVLKMGIKASEQLDEAISIAIDSEGFEISCNGDSDSMSLRVPAIPVADADPNMVGIIPADACCDAESAIVSTDGKVRSSYPLNYVSMISKVIPDKTPLDIRLDNDYPVKVNFPLCENSIRVVYFLAPRIENE